MATVLVVDDRAVNREFLATLLGYAGHTVLQAADGAEALRIVGDRHPDLVITDVLMPTMGGIEFANAMHAEPATAAIPIVFYTATYRLPEAQKLGQLCGASAVLAKPSEPQTILDTVAAALGLVAPVLALPAGGSHPGFIADRLPAYLRELTELQQRLQYALDQGLELIGAAGPLREISDSLIRPFTTVQALSMRLAALLELSLVLPMEQEPQRLLDLFCRAAQDIMNTQYTAAVILDAHGKRPQHWSSRGLPPPISAMFGSIDPRAGIFGQVLVTGAPRRLRDLDGAPDRWGLPAEHPPIRNLLATPIAASTSAHGWLYFADKVGDAVFTDDDEQFAATLAAQLALSYGNLAMHHEIQERAAELEVEVAERRRAAEELRESESRFRQLAENIREVFWLTDPSKKEILYVSPAYEKIWGRSCERLYAWPREWFDALHPEDRARIRDALVKQTRGDYDEEYRVVRPDGAVHWVRDRAFPVYDSSGNVYRIAGVAEDITERKRAAEELRESERRFRDMLGNVQLVSLMLDVEARITYCNDYLLRLTGWRREEVIGRDWFELFIPPDIDDLKNVFEALIRDLPSAWHHENEILTRSGARRLIRWNNSVLRSAAGEVIGTASIGEDITERKEQEEKIARLSRIYAVLSGINSAIVRVHERQALFEEACRIAVEQGQFGMAWLGLLDHDTQDVRLTASRGIDGKLFEKIRLSARANVPEGEGTAGAALRSKQTVFCNDITVEPQVGAIRAEAITQGFRSVVSLPLLVDDAVVGVLVLYAQEADFFDEDELKLLNELAGDISFGLQYIEKEEKLDYLAYYDALTDLPNSTLFHDRLTQFLHGAKGNRNAVSVMLIDLDRFTQLNDTLGRHVGDTLLKAVAKRLAKSLREPYTLARISADMFAVAVADLQNDTDAAAVLQQGIFAPLDRPFTVGEREIRLSAKTGVALHPGDGRDAETLFKNAEAALKQAKLSGERYLYYAPEINAEVAQRLALESKLRRAAELQQFVLHYQPKINTQNGRIIGLEALIRWNDPETGLVQPTHFIRLLEDMGLIIEVGRWVLDKALADYRHWLDQGLRPPRIAVNVSQIQLKRDDFVETVRQAIERSGVGRDSLELEITESLVMEDIEATTEKLNRIRDMGVTVAIDDFGTGYSSLRYLAKLPVASLKIDCSFIVTMVTDSDSMAIVSTVIALAHSLGLTVVAEGVTSEEQAKFLKLLKCDEMQGYHYGRPVSAKDIEPLLSKERSIVEGHE